MIVNLKFMGFHPQYSEPYIEHRELQKVSRILMRKNFALSELPELLGKYVGRIQTYLRILGYYLSISKVDQTFTELTRKSLFLYYKDYNCTLEKYNEGKLDKQEASLWWDCEQELRVLPESYEEEIEAKLQWRVIMLLQALKALGYNIPNLNDDDSFYGELENTLKQYQKASLIFETGFFDQRTVQSILSELSRLSLSVGVK